MNRTGFFGLSEFKYFNLFQMVSMWLTCRNFTTPENIWHDKTNKVTVRAAKTQISLGIRPVWSESSLCTQWVAKDPSFLHADNEDSDQTMRMPKLMWVFAGRTLILLVLSCRGSYFTAISWNVQRCCSTCHLLTQFLECWCLLEQLLRVFKLNPFHPILWKNIGNIFKLSTNATYR